MLAFLLRRALQGIAIVFSVATLTFLLVHLAPGEPFGSMLEDPRVTGEMRGEFRARYGLDRPLHAQYVHYLSNVSRGDLGMSFTHRRPVRDVLGEALPRSILLVGTALLLGFTGGIVLGVVQAAVRGSFADRLLTRLTVLFSAVPDFWLALALLVVFARVLQWLPSSGMADEALAAYFTPAQRLVDVLRHMVLPVSSLAIIIFAVVARYQRAAILEVLPEDYIRTAHAKGLRRRDLLRRHAMRNAVLPIITLLGLSLPSLASGALFVETIFAWPGMGSAAVAALSERDYPMVLGAVLAGSVIVVIGSLLTDMLYAAIDPRLRHA